MGVRCGPWRRLSAKEMMPLNCGQRNDAFERLEKTLESPLDSKEIKPVNPKGNQPWIFTGMTDAEAEAPILWPPDEKSRLTGKAPEVEKDWRWGKGITEDKMVGWHHRPNGHESEQVPGDVERQGSLACCSSWGWKESDTVEQVNTTVTTPPIFWLELASLYFLHCFTLFLICTSVFILNMSFLIHN